MKPSAKGQVGNALVNATHGSMDTCFVTKNKQDTCRILLSKEEEEKKQTNTNPLSYCSQHVWIKFQLTFVSEYWSNLQTFLTLFVKCEDFTSSLLFFYRCVCDCVKGMLGYQLIQSGVFVISFCPFTWQVWKLTWSLVQPNKATRQKQDFGLLANEPCCGFYQCEGAGTKVWKKNYKNADVFY